VCMLILYYQKPAKSNRYTKFHARFCNIFSLVAIVILSGLFIAVTTVGITLIGDGLRDVFE